MRRPMKARTSESLDECVHTMRDRRVVSIWEPVVTDPLRDAEIAIPIEQQIIDTILQPSSETHHDANRRKELELAALFETLSPAESLTLQRRLSNPRSGDAVASAFLRLIAERRNRLLAFLARRRAAKSAARLG
jgi:hypothetical protein